MAASLTEGLEKILNNLEGCTLNTEICEEIEKVLNYNGNAKPQLIQKLLELCIQNPKDDLKYVTETLNIVSIILRKVMVGEFTSKPDLLPSMLEIIHMLNTSVYSCTLDQIKIIYFKTLCSYPDEIYLKLEKDTDVLELFNLYFHQRIPTELKLQAINVLHKYLKVLPPGRRLKCVEQGINIWLSKLVPNVLLFVTIPEFDIETPLVTLELVVNEFHHINYYDIPNWQSLLHCFYEPQKYPTILKKLLAKGSNIWHRLWIVFIKMLKNHLTKSGNSGSPINTMLPVVETAFKMDITNRCRAFHCWNVLIDNFATETNEAYMNKRIKLLVIPLYSNNAKVEETVIAKINTWWHLICSYYSKLSNFAEIILIPFLQFCFVKRTVSGKTVNAPGMLTDKTKEYCVEALVNIFGHFNREGCVSLPVLKEKIINEKCLLAYKKDFMHCLSAAIRIVANNPRKLRQPCKCAWKSLITSICEITDNKVRKDYFNQLLGNLENLIEHTQNEILADILLNDFILTLFEDDQNIQLLNLIDERDNPIHKIVSIILNPSVDSTYNGNDMVNAVENLTPFADFIVEHCFHTDIIDTLLNQLLADYKSLVLWTAMTSAINKKKIDSEHKILNKILQWPLKHLHIFTKVQFSTSLWLVLFDFVHTKLGSLNIDEILEVFNDCRNINETNYSFFFNVSIMLLNHKICVGKNTEYEKEVRLLYDTANKIFGLSHKNSILSKLIDILLELLKNLLKYINVNIIQRVLMILKLVFTQLMSNFQKSTEVDAELLMKVEQVLKSVEDLLKVEAYASVKEIVLADFLEYAQCFGQQKPLKAPILAILQMFLNNMDNNNPLVKSIKNAITSLNEDSNCISSTDNPKFTTPNTKKTKKKECSIVNSTVEDGEEFVVIKSNWRFNPKKLTDNQKEKLKRKREDIPALYQDLSQSQDEFKLKTWKSDSQDTTTTSSKSNDLTTSEKVSSILKNMPNTDVVPKILKNILIENNEKNKQINSALQSTNEDINEIQPPMNKESKLKLSLKDRVFRNVRVLVEKSDVRNCEQHVNLVNDDIAPQLQTPIGQRIRMTETNSAPTEIHADRPSRVKRKPKKFEEMQIFATKKRCHSLCNNESENRNLLEDLSQSQDVIHNSEVGDPQMNSSNVPDIQNDQNTITQNVIEDELKHSNAENKNILSNDQEMLVKGEMVDKVQDSIKSNDISATSRVDIEDNVAVDNLSAATSDKNQIDNDQFEAKEDQSTETPLKKKTGKKKSRIEKELAIDMVEGHPFLKIQSEKRLTRKKLLESPAISRRKSLTQKLNKSKVDQKNTPHAKVDKKLKQTGNLLDKSSEFDTLSDSQETSLQDANGSQDFIESSQDSTVSIMSVKSSKTVKRIPVVNIEPKALFDNTNQNHERLNVDNKTVNDDSEFPLNKRAIEYVEIDLTENLDTEPLEDGSSNEVIEIKDEETPIAPNLNSTCPEMDTQDIADADTQPVDLNNITTIAETNTPDDETQNLDAHNLGELETSSMNNIDSHVKQIQDECTISLTESLVCEIETKQKNESLSKTSPKNEEQRKQDFLNNTLEISPIKTLSPVRENKSPSPETSSDYVVIKLSSPVQSNGEPFEKCDSPEVFTEEKVSPDKRDQSPPREESRLATTSPRSLSLKRNKPQVRSGGRAAQMLGLCIPAPDRLQTIINSEKSVEAEEPKKSSPLTSSAKRNLRMLYNSTNESTSETSEESEGCKNFLKMKRNLPPADSSPSVPILKRKLADIVDDTTVSPANKRKRVSFHDPPVSTTVCVKKYIEASSVRSPQNSATKRQERQTRSQMSGNLKSQKRLDTVFKLDTALTKAVESFSETDTTPNVTEDTEMSSLEPTPLVEVVKNSELNDLDPICIELIDCTDPVDNIAGELSSSTMRPLLVKEFAGKIETVGDLAKMTELEVNRLCIKAPKVQVAKKVLEEYAKNINTVANEMTPNTEAAFSESTVFESKALDVEMQTDCAVVGNVEVQTETLPMSVASTQTNTVSTVDCDIQTHETTADIAVSLLEKPDFCQQLNMLLDVPSKQSIATSLPLSVLIDTATQEMGLSKLSEIIDRLLEKHTSCSIDGQNDNPRLSFMTGYLSERFSSKDLILLCSELLKKVHNSSP